MQTLKKMKFIVRYRKNLLPITGQHINVCESEIWTKRSSPQIYVRISLKIYDAFTGHIIVIIIPSDPINIGNTVDSQLPAEACSCHGNISKLSYSCF